jgi:hypothetical protein
MVYTKLLKKLVIRKLNFVALGGNKKAREFFPDIAIIVLYLYLVQPIIHMKSLILLFFLFPFSGKGGFNNVPATADNLIQVRSGLWPISLQKIIVYGDTSYALQFRDQQFMNANITATLQFCSLGDLKDFAKGLSALKMGTNGDIAQYNSYTIKRVDVKKESLTWYTLISEGGAVTNFKQFEANLLIRTINNIKI